jgi:membrane-bound serine protease (ClpP class)
VLSLLANVRFDFSPVDFNSLLEALFIVLLAIIGAMVLSFEAARHLLGNPRFGIALAKTQQHEEGYVAADTSLASLIGAEGTAYSILRPAGKVLIEQDVYDAVCREGYIEKGEKIRVKDFKNAQLIVEKTN